MHMYYCRMTSTLHEKHPIYRFFFVFSFLVQQQTAVNKAMYPLHVGSKAINKAGLLIWHMHGSHQPAEQRCCCRCHAHPDQPDPADSSGSLLVAQES